DEPESGVRLAASRAGQVAIKIDMQEIAWDTRRDVARLRERDPGQIGAITQHRYVAHNAPVIAGTRIPTSVIWSFHQAGYDIDAIIREYPLLTEADIRAAIDHEARRRQQAAS